MAREHRGRAEARRGVAALGLAVRRVRRKRGWSQERLAAAAKVSVESLGRLERGDSNPTLLRVVRLAEALEVRPAVLFRLAERLHAAGELDVQEDG